MDRLSSSLAMITQITGRLASVTGSSAVVAPEGWPFRYQVLLPAYLAERLAARIGETVTLTTLEYLESPNQGTSFTPRIVGFDTPGERDFFELFTTVKGIGTRKALRALTQEPAALAALISARDTRGLQALPEIGKRLAETIIAELSGKVERFVIASSGQRAAAPSAVKPGTGAARDEAIAALMALGEVRSEAELRVDAAIRQVPGPGPVEVSTILAAVFNR